MKVKERCPNFVAHDPDDLRESDFNSVEELHNIDWIKRWITDPGFYRLSVRGSRDLMCEYDGGKRFYFIARLEDNSVGLPQWVRPEKK